jgi:hypothetical protein
MKFIETIKIKTLETREKSSDIIVEELILQTEDVLLQLPKISLLVDRITRRINSVLGFFPIQTCDIPAQLHKDYQGNQFFRYDSGVEDPFRIVLVASEFKEKYIENSSIWLIDGTFNTAPLGVYQLLTIQGYILGKTYHLIYVLMSNKTEDAYVNVFTLIKNMFSPNPLVIITDLEKGLINASKKVFESTNSRLC